MKRTVRVLHGIPPNNPLSGVRTYKLADGTYMRVRGGAGVLDGKLVAVELDKWGYTDHVTVLEQDEWKGAKVCLLGLLAFLVFLVILGVSLGVM